MEIENQSIYREASQLLKSVYGGNARFRDGQYEAIEATMLKKRTLVVQKTGWGKSLVYFICTKLKRSHGRGMTLVISPLLVLMENQMEMAKSMGLRCAALNSSVEKTMQESIRQQMKSDKLDMVFATPETLLKKELRSVLPSVRIGLFVIDEAHCISDWGHDFRLEYGKLSRIISGEFSNVSILATTATANDRVVADLKAQLGNDVFISRGPLTRDSLHIQILPLENRIERYAWLLDNLPKLPGTGIIYCLDHVSCDCLADFLQQNGISAKSYYSRESKEEALNQTAIDDFQHNRIKAIVATIKLGMGYDKGDVSFVIHFQSPASIVAWYQQIGRAGRNLKDAYVFLMTGREDNDIQDYFIRTAFPDKQTSEEIMNLISRSNGLTMQEIFAQINARYPQIKKALYFMESDGFIWKDSTKDGTVYYSTTRKYVYPQKHYEAVTEVRKEEQQQMQKLIHTSKCLSRFAVNCLDDKAAPNCGKCANCTGRDVFPGLSISDGARQKARCFSYPAIVIEPRKKWPDGKWILSKYRLQSGICLSKYGAPGNGELVKQGKYPSKGMPHFDDRLVSASAELLKKLIRENGITHITFVPSMRSNLVEDFTRRLSRATGLCFVPLLKKSPAKPQKEMQNSGFQCKNALNSFYALSTVMPEKVILVDDIVDSRWTLTVCGYKMIEKGCSEVYPYALADSSYSEE